MSFLRSDMDQAYLEGDAAMIIREDTGEIIDATALLEDMFGYTMRGELSTGRTVADLIPEVLKEPDPAARPMGKAINVQGKKQDGSSFPVVVTLRGKVISGIRCVIVSVMDMAGWGNNKDA